MEGKSLPHSLSTEHYQIFLLQVDRVVLEEWEASGVSEAIQVSLGIPAREQRAVAARLHLMAVLTLPVQEEIVVLGGTPDPMVLPVPTAQLPRPQIDNRPAAVGLLLIHVLMAQRQLPDLATSLPVWGLALLLLVVPSSLILVERDSRSPQPKPALCLT
jgi:hypothetical protein